MEEEQQEEDAIETVGPTPADEVQERGTLTEDMILPEGYEVHLDDHCLVVGVKEEKLYLSREMCLWIKNNYDVIDFENDKFVE